MMQFFGGKTGGKEIEKLMNMNGLGLHSPTKKTNFTS